MKSLRTVVVPALLLALAAVGHGEPPARPKPDAKPQGADASAKAFVAKHCLACHSGAKPKGGLSLNSLTSDMSDKSNRERWLVAMEQVKSGAMPPEKRPRPVATEVAALADWVNARIEVAELGRRAKQGRATARRLNRVEYENTVRDLLGIDVELKELLPPDATANGFDTSGDAHHVSQFLMESYLEAADKALNFAIANYPKPDFVKKQYSLKDERIVKVTTESVYLKRDDELVMFSSSAWNSIVVGQFYPPDRGRYRVRISARAIQSGGKPVAFRVDAGPMLMGTKQHLVGYFDAPEGEAKVFEFTDHFEARNHIRIAPHGLATAHVLNKIGAEKYTGPGLAVQWVEVEGPLHESWPPESHRRIFGDLPQAKSPVRNDGRRVEVISANPEADASAVLKNFARRAFRRAVTDDEVRPYLAVVKNRFAEKYRFEAAVRVGL
jgi:mono/diheme cytochrome c family protein